MFTVARRIKRAGVSNTGWRSSFKIRTPVSEAQLAAALVFRTLTDAEAFEVADAGVSTVLMNHPIPNFGYRIDFGGKTLFFTED
jgi:hypothetical protein